MENIKQALISSNAIIEKAIAKIPQSSDFDHLAGSLERQQQKNNEALVEIEQKITKQNELANILAKIKTILNQNPEMKAVDCVGVKGVQNVSDRA